MKVLVDTSVWSLVLRRDRPNQKLTQIMTELVDDGRVLMIGPIRQEILSGHKNKKQFEILREKLSAFPDLSLRTEHYEQAARYFNLCREKGVQGSHVDFLICATAALEKIPILTTDRDFTGYAKHLDIQLFGV